MSLLIDAANRAVEELLASESEILRETATDVLIRLACAMEQSSGIIAVGMIREDYVSRHPQVVEKLDGLSAHRTLTLCARLTELLSAMNDHRLAHVDPIEHREGFWIKIAALKAWKEAALVQLHDHRRAQGLADHL
jgi:hypothetical protein